MKRSREFKRLRRQLGRTQLDIAKCLEITPRTVARMESGRVRVPMIYLHALQGLCKT